MNAILRILLIFTIFLFPILNFNFGFGNDLFLRFLFLLISCAISAFLFFTEVLKKKEKITFLPIYGVIFVFLLFAFVASFFSADFYNSIFGFLGENLKSVLGLFVFSLLVFLIFQVFNQELLNIFKPFFAISYLIFALTIVFKLQYNYALPFLQFSYPPIQSGIFLIIGYFLIINLFADANILSKIIKLFFSILIFYLLLSFDIWFLWILFGIAALIDFFVLYFSQFKIEFNINLRLVIFALALFFIISPISFGIFPKIPEEAFLTHNASINISLKAVLEKPFFGWGFNNFDIVYSLNKPQAVNLTNLYAIDFAAPRTFFEEMFVSSGIIGGILFLGILVMIGYYVFKIFRGMPDFRWLINFYFLIVLAGFLVPFSSILLYLFFLLVIFVSLLLKEKAAFKFSLNQEIVGVFGGIFILVVMLAVFVRFFAASYYFTKAALIKDSDIKNESLKIALAKNAISFNPYNPLYIQQYSAYLFNKAKEKTFSANPDFNQIGALIQAAIESAVSLENQYKNRAVFKYYLATLYADSRIYADKPEDFLNMAEKFIQEAIQLAPRNVIYKSFLGDVYYFKALLKKEKKMRANLIVYFRKRKVLIRKRAQ